MVAQAAAQASAEMMAEAPVAEPAPMMAKADPAPSFAQAFADPAPSVQTVEPASNGIRYVSNPVVQPLPANADRAPAPRMAASSQRRMAPAAVTAPVANDKSLASHLVQLGSYDSKAEAQRGWTMLKAKFPQLKDHDVVITEAVVNGRTFWRVAADGFGPKSARSLCSTVKSAGRGCFAYAASNPPAGAVKSDVRMASRLK
jgi:hypothetical protein